MIIQMKPLPQELLVSNFDLKPLFKNQENIKIIQRRNVFIF